MSEVAPIRIVIVGGGFAGLACAHRLGRLIHPWWGAPRRVGSRAVEVTLASPENYFVFQPLLADVIGASIEPRHVVSPLRRLLPRTDVRWCEVESVDVATRRVRFRPQEGRAVADLVADHLVLAPGQATDLARVPGLAEHGLPLRTLGDAIEIRNRVIRGLEAASVTTDPAERARLLSFVVVGAGFSGVEVAGQVHDLLRGAARAYPTLAGPGAPPPRVVLVQRGDRILTPLDPRLSAFALDRLRRRGIEVRLGRGVSACTAGGVRLDDGTEVPAATVVSTVGNTTHPLVAALGRPLAGRRLLVEPTFALPGAPGVWAIGDCAAIPQSDGSHAPEMAQFAVREGELAARNIWRALHGLPPTPFAYRGVGELASLGHRTGVAQLFGVRFAGLLAWWLWRTVYLFKLPGLDRRLRVAFDWTLDLVFPRDVVQLDVRRSARVARRHCESGEVIFRAGEPSETFYVVEKGQVEVVRSAGSGAPEVRVALLGPGEHFGERALVAREPHSATARAVTTATLLTLAGPDFAALAGTLVPLRRAIEEAVRRAQGTAGEPSPLPADLGATVGTLRVADVMSAPAVTVAHDATLADALRLVLGERRGCLPVLDGDGRLAGIVTRTNLYRALDAGRALTTPLAEVADARALTVTPEMPALAAAETLRRERVKRLIVVAAADGRRVVGVVSRLDLVRAHLARGGLESSPG